MLKGILGIEGLFPTVSVDQHVINHVTRRSTER
jgi:hypothetical protein